MGKIMFRVVACIVTWEAIMRRVDMLDGSFADYLALTYIPLVVWFVIEAWRRP